MSRTLSMLPPERSSAGGALPSGFADWRSVLASTRASSLGTLPEKSGVGETTDRNAVASLVKRLVVFCARRHLCIEVRHTRGYRRGQQGRQATSPSALMFPPDPDAFRRP